MVVFSDAVVLLFRAAGAVVLEATGVLSGTAGTSSSAASTSN